MITQHFCPFCGTEAYRTMPKDDLWHCSCAASRGYYVSWNAIWSQLGYRYKG